MPVLLFFAACASAVSISAADSVAAGSVWSVSVSLPNAGEFNFAKIFLDGSQIAKVNGDSGIYFPPSSADSSRVLSATVSGNNANFLLAGLSRGTHTVSVSVDGGDSVGREVNFFDVLSAEEQGSLQSQLNSLRGSVNSLVEQYNALEGKGGGVLTEDDKQEFLGELGNVKASIEEMQQRLSAAESDGAATKGELGLLLGDVEALGAKAGVSVAAAENAALESSEQPTGLFSLPPLDPGLEMAMLVVVAAAAAIGLIFLNRGGLSRSGSVYSGKSVPEFSSTYIEVKKEIEKEEEEEMQAKNPKWAFDKKPAAEEKKPFGIGDIVRKR
ncbi:MAG: hypothetical protein NTW59_02945 [Candidatus Diapherotrites archaeon]|nr:hypothetical protein [Candidatus Diapherotrites archaeon]